jgi:hypothetical protein
MSNCQCQELLMKVQAILRESDANLRLAMAVSLTDVINLKMDILSKVKKTLNVHCTCFIGHNLRNIVNMLDEYFSMEGKEFISRDVYAKETEKVFDKLMRILYNIRAS